MAQWERRKNLYSFAHGRTEAHVTELAEYLESINSKSGEELRKIGAVEAINAIHARHGSGQLAKERKAVGPRAVNDYDPLEDL